METKEGIDNEWFLPQFQIDFPVKSTTQVMIVYHGSARYEEQSWNDVTHPGPKLQQDE